MAMLFRRNVLNYTAVIVLVSLFAGCGSTRTNRNVVGETFPTVQGKTLDGHELSLPDAFKGKKVILVIGYEEKSQFDLDRWGVGFFTADLQLPPVYEIAAIPGLIPSLIDESIDSEMRGGLPQESWKEVLTVYGGDATTLSQWTGTQGARNCRVLLLDENGKVLWMHDRGYGIAPLRLLLDALKASGGR
jgi:hypothetical protein